MTTKIDDQLGIPRHSIPRFLNRVQERDSVEYLSCPGRLYKTCNMGDCYYYVC
jgi:hypothetical protein